MDVDSRDRDPSNYLKKFLLRFGPVSPFSPRWAWEGVLLPPEGAAAYSEVHFPAHALVMAGLLQSKGETQWSQGLGRKQLMSLDEERGELHASSGTFKYLEGQ